MASKTLLKILEDMLDKHTHFSKTTALTNVATSKRASPVISIQNSEWQYAKK